MAKAAAPKKIGAKPKKAVHRKAQSKPAAKKPVPAHHAQAAPAPSIPKPEIPPLHEAILKPASSAGKPMDSQYSIPVIPAMPQLSARRLYLELFTMKEGLLVFKTNVGVPRAQGIREVQIMQEGGTDPLSKAYTMDIGEFLAARTGILVEIKPILGGRMAEISFSGGAEKYTKTITVSDNSSTVQAPGDMLAENPKDEYPEKDPMDEEPMDSEEPEE
jgi:hypothetical protein